MLEHGMVNAADADLFCFADDAESAWSRLAARGVGACSDEA
jgi:hypothetical protein